MEALALTVMADASDPEHRLVVALALAEANMSAAVYPQSLLPDVDFLHVVFKTSRRDVLTRYVAVTARERQVMTAHPERFNAAYGSYMRADRLREWSLLYLEVCRSMAHHSGFFYPDSERARSLPGVEVLFGVDTPLTALERMQAMRWASQIQGDEYVALAHIFRTFALSGSRDSLLRLLPAVMLSDDERAQVRAHFEANRKVGQGWYVQWWAHTNPVAGLRQRKAAIGRCERLVGAQSSQVPSQVQAPKGRYALVLPYRPELAQPDIVSGSSFERISEGFTPRGEGFPYRGRGYVFPEPVALCERTYLLEVDENGGVLCSRRWDPIRQDFVASDGSPESLEGVSSEAHEAENPFSAFLPWLQDTAVFVNPITDGRTFRAILSYGNALCAVSLEYTGSGLVSRRTLFGTP